MDALELLKADHDKVKQLLELCRSENSIQKKKQFLTTIKNELTVHTDIEEKIFYPAFKNYPEFQEIVERSYREHKELSQELNQLNLQASVPTDLDQHLNRISQIVLNHVQEEETEFFPRVRKIMKRNEREILGRHMQAAKQEISMAA